jgi:hypothetical protein
MIYLWVILFIFQPFGIFYGHFGIFSPFLARYSNENPETLEKIDI